MTQLEYLKASIEDGDSIVYACEQVDLDEMRAEGDIHEAVQDLQDPSVALQVLSDIQQNKLCEYATDVA